MFSSQDVELCLWFRSSLINYVLLLLGQGRKENTQIHTLYLFDFTENVYIQLFYCKWGTCGIHIYRRETDGAASPCVCPQRLWSLRYTKDWRFGDSVYIIHRWKNPGVIDFRVSPSVVYKPPASEPPGVSVKMQTFLNPSPPQLYQVRFSVSDVVLVGREPLEATNVTLWLWGRRYVLLGMTVFHRQM